MTIYERLRQWRKAEADSLRLPVFFVLSNAHLAAVAVAVPLTHEELAACPGMGPKKLAYYGESLLAVLHQAVNDGLEPGVIPSAPPPVTEESPLSEDDIVAILGALQAELATRLVKRFKGRYSKNQVAEALRRLSFPA